MNPERSPQQLDPLGTLAAWGLAPVGGVVAIGYAVLSTFWHRDQQAHPTLAGAALTVLVIAVVALVFFAVPRRAPLRRTAFVVVLLLAVAADGLSTAATWGLDRMIQDDWGQIAFAVLLVSMTQLRPAIDLAFAAGAGAVVIGTIAALPASHYAISVGATIYGVVAATPILALGLGATTYARVMVRTTESWQQSARDGMARLEPDVRAVARRTVRQQQITELNARAVPLFTRLIERGVLTGADIDEAADIASQLRGQALQLVRSGWLDDVLTRAGVRSEIIGDGGDALAFVTGDQRAALGAYVATLARLERGPRPLTDTGGIRLPMRRTVSSDSTSGDAPPVLVVRIRVAAEAPAGADPRARIVCSTEVSASRRVAKRALMPYVSVLRVVSYGARLRVRDHTVTLGFGYDTV